MSRADIARADGARFTRLAAQLDRTALRHYDANIRRRAWACDDAVAQSLDAAAKARRQARQFDLMDNIPDLTGAIDGWLIRGAS